jgi:hypothetical protein
VRTDHVHEIVVLSMDYWTDEAYFSDTPSEKALMYDIAAKSADKIDTHHAAVLRRIANNYREAI